MINIGKSDPFHHGRVQADTIAVLSLVANTEQHFTVPASATQAVFSCTGNYYILTNGQTAAVPAATNTSFPSPNTNPELNPSMLSVVDGTTVISAVAPANCILTISFYRESGSSTNV